MADTFEMIDNIDYQFTLITSIILTIVGFIGNSLTVFIMAKPKMRNISMFRYLIVSMVNDCWVLVTMWFCTFSEAFQNSSISCKWTNYIEYLNYNYSGWIVVVSLADRLITVKFPYKFMFRNQLKFQVFVLLVIYIILIFLNIPFYIYYDIDDLSNQSICEINDPNTGFYVELSGALMGVIIPFILMLIISSLIGRFLTKKGKSIHMKKSLKKEVRLIKMMISMSIFFITCNLPFYIQQLIHDVLFFDDSKLSNSISNFIFNITNQLTFVYNSFGFFICLFSNNVFREYFYSNFVFRQQTLVHPLNTNS